MAREKVAQLLLASAKRDRQAFLALIAVPDMNDAVIGFHAHQCIEKASKAVLAHAGIAFRRTHNLGALIDLLHDTGHELPPFATCMDELNPYAVETRYGVGEPAVLDRGEVSRMVEAVMDWAQAQLAQPLGRK